MGLENPGARVNAIDVLDAKIKTAKKVVDALEKERSNLKTDLLGSMNENGISELYGEHCGYAVAKKEIVIIDDWQQVREYVQQTGDIDIFQRRFNGANLSESIESRGALVPGLSKGNVRYLKRKNKS